VLEILYARYGYSEHSLAELPAFLLRLVDELVITLEPYRQNGRLLDVGFGAGALLRSARDRGWQTSGIERSPPAITAAEGHRLGELILGDFPTAPLASAPFDVVTMIEIIEHLAHPDPFLRRAREVLRPGGVLCLTTPHGRGLNGRLRGPAWSMFAPPEHLELYSIASITHRLRRAGFEHIHVSTRSFFPNEILSRLANGVLGRLRLGDSLCVYAS
jgi:2-polyprenyl-3-methyl-5-hydroxy-6-metoxy-1,4-benzoquinol methylase